eukprot:2073946-Rhodomonas_salina.1
MSGISRLWTTPNDSFLVVGISRSSNRVYTVDKSKLYCSLLIMTRTTASLLAGLDSDDTSIPSVVAKELVDNPCACSSTLTAKLLA